DEETIEAIKLLSKHAGIFAEPGGAVTVAAVKKMREEGVIDSGDEVVCCVTGAGFKVDEVVDRVVGHTHVVPAKLDSILEVLRNKPVISG
ncbi:MAG: hypothetical protein QXH52_05525, partial [Candidatus Caldarchaeum sp.]